MKKTRIRWFTAIVLILLSATIAYGAIPQNTIRQDAGIVMPTVNATAGYYVGTTQIIDAARSAVFADLNATGAYTFGSLFDANTTFSVNYSWVGDAMRVNCGENVSAGELVRFGDVGRVRLTDADLETHVPCVGMALEDGVYSGGSVGESTLILFRGFVYNSVWNITQGDPVFVGEAAGEMQVTAPSDSGDQVQVIGIAYTDTILYFNPDYTVLEIT